MFSHFFDYFIFENFDQNNQKKNHFLVKRSVFWAINANIFKNYIIKKGRKHYLDDMYLDGFGKFLVIFVPKYFFTLVKKKKKYGQKKSFWQFLKNTIFNQKSDYLNRFLMKFPF